MHHLPDDRAGADDGDFDDEIVEAVGLEPRQRRHLRARLDLEHADGVGRAQHPIDRGIVGRQIVAQARSDACRELLSDSPGCFAILPTAVPAPGC